MIVVAAAWQSTTVGTRDIEPALSAGGAGGGGLAVPGAGLAVTVTGLMHAVRRRRARGLAAALQVGPVLACAASVAATAARPAAQQCAAGGAASSAAEGASPRRTLTQAAALAGSCSSE